jgi:branched-chain amino acid transport system ATP-binding protein
MPENDLTLKHVKQKSVEEVSEEILLRINNIDVFYGNLQVLWDISLEVRQGEIIAIAGANGAGKSSLLKAISGVLHPGKGSIEFAGVDITMLNPYDIVALGISQVPEGRKLFPEMTVLENLYIGSFRRDARLQRGESLTKVYELFPILEERKNQLAKTLSGGQQQMVAIGRGLMAVPKVMIIDEMSLGLSPLIVSDLFRVLHEIKDQGITILLVEQNVWQTLHEADRAYVIETGRIVLSGKALDLMDEEDVKNAYFGDE